MAAVAAAATDIFRAIRDKDVARVRALVAADPGIVAAKSSGMSATPLLTAATVGDAEIVELLLVAGSDVTEQNASGNTVLHNAAQKGHTALLERFLSIPAAATLIDAGNNGERTALGLAAREGHAAATALLLRHGARIRLDDIDIARERGHVAIAESLTQAFADPLRFMGVPAPPAVGAASPGVFLLAGGHGAEDFDHHDIVPPGRTLVTMAKCGAMLVNAEIFRKLAGVFTSEHAAAVKTLLLDVDRRAAGIEDFLGFPRGTLRIYRAGERCPRLFYMPVSIQRLPGIAVYEKSGTYALPTERDALFTSAAAEAGAGTRAGGAGAEAGAGGAGAEDDIIRFVLPATDPVDNDLLDILYTGSIYPTVEGAQALFSAVGSDIHKFESLMVTPVSQIMERLGAGVYFYTVCRSGLKTLNVEEFVLRGYDKDPATFRPYLLDVPGRLAEIVERFNPPMAANTAGRIKAIMERRKRSSSERRGKQKGGSSRRRRITRRRRRN